MRMLVTLALALQLASGAALAETIQRRAAADARGLVEIVNVAGEVQVAGWDRAEVEVNAELGSNVERLDFVSEGGRTLIKVVLPSGGRSGASDLQVRVPAGSSLAINTVSADQTISGVRGSQRLQAVSGQITTEVHDAEFEAKTVSGDIDVRGHGEGGVVRVNTVSGDMHLSDMGPALDLTSVTGDIEVAAKTLERVRVKTTNGNLDLSGALTKDGRIEAEAVNGDLRFMLRNPVNAEFDIETFNGDIQNCFGPEPRQTREFAPGNELRFREGDGGGRVRIKTLNGGVEICRK